MDWPVTRAGGVVCCSSFQPQSFEALPLNTGGGENNFFYKANTPLLHFFKFQITTSFHQPLVSLEEDKTPTHRLQNPATQKGTKKDEAGGASRPSLSCALYTHQPCLLTLTCPHILLLLFLLVLRTSTPHRILFPPLSTLTHTIDFSSLYLSSFHYSHHHPTQPCILSTLRHIVLYHPFYSSLRLVIHFSASFFH
ncbi:hypothetical protein E2C01_001318 [Portunus trituberculatus]|uniref:Uncharacterized protein n=1 Tax=Portunus trituberculatus TaxID=210409 RepID=A0A5B7CJ31_PORTR|nr:hypothetical protein [Portunus trituberculatus]